MEAAKTIKVLVVDDSQVTRMLLVQIINSDPALEVLGTANNGREACEFVEHNLPDVILMDIHMPEMDGFDATRSIMETRPVPIVICSSSCNTRETATAFRLMEAGAVACVEKPFGKDHSDYEQRATHLLQTVKLMAEVKVVRRWARMRNGSPGKPASVRPREPGTGADMLLVGIGASTGGPPVIQTILTGLPRDFALPILIVQHIAQGFLPGLAEWLDQTTGMKTHIASHAQQPLPGHVYLAPDDYHMTVDAGGQIALNRRDPENGLRPSVNFLFRSLAERWGGNAIGILLTGMGKDGAEGLKQMHERGALTIAQDRESSIVHGMPGEAIALGAATHVLSADKIAGALTAFVQNEALSFRRTP